MLQMVMDEVILFLLNSVLPVEDSKLIGFFSDK
jgi:hypothetical protein